jgi:bifunctional UDP-N-acetylglucosamine pyrophosphorylase/glucosamine-1-phosphate N-acetyltransferase
MKLHAIILAAGQGTRMKSPLPKVLHPVGGKPMLGHVLEAAGAAEAAACHVVLGHAADQVRAWLESSGAERVHVAVQEQQLGTAHAVQQAMPDVPDDALVVVLYGDVPLVSGETIRAVTAAGREGLSMVTARLEDPTGYGRLLREAGKNGAPGRVTGIVEEKDASPEQRAITEVNTGVIAAPARRLKRWLAHVKNDNAKGEYYLTDVAGLAAADGVEIKTYAVKDAGEMEGVNDLAQLGEAERRFQRARAVRFQREGLRIADAARFDLRGSLKFGRDVFIDVGCVFEGAVELGDGVRIGPYCLLRDAELGAGTRVEAHSVLDMAEAGRDCVIGPYARLRPGAKLADEVHIGNFVEIKKSTLGHGSKANHLAYVGDANVGERVNIGAGVITCNYDGAEKHVTTIGDDAFIGTDSQLVAPVTIGRGSYIAAGSTITKNTPEDSLTICRAREQKTLAGWKRPVKKKK